MITFDCNKKGNKLLIQCEDPSIFEHLREQFSVLNPNATFIQRKFGRGFKVPARKYVITPTGQCELGLFWEIKQKLIKDQITVPITVTDNLKSVLLRGNMWDLHTDFTLDLRDYQRDVVEKALTVGWGTCVLGTGAGKTFTTAALIENYYRNSKNNNTFKCLVVVPDLGLVNQTFDEFNACGITFSLSKWTGSIELDTTSNVIICNAGILQSRFDQNDWIKFVDLLVLDECHKVKSDSKLSKIVSEIKTVNRYGFTGTLPVDQFDKWHIIGKLGPVLYEKSSYDLRQEKFLSNVEVKVLNINYGKVTIPKISDNKYYNELLFLHDYEPRNNIIAKLANQLTNNTLILVNRIAHGEALYNHLCKTVKDKQIFFIQGSVGVDTRDEIKKLMEEHNNVVCIAISAIFSTGINIKNLNNILFAAGGKAFIRTVQSIGRGLRLHENKLKLFIFDLCDVLKYGLQHGEKRKLIYDKEKIPWKSMEINI